MRYSQVANSVNRTDSLAVLATSLGHCPDWPLGFHCRVISAHSIGNVMSQLGNGAVHQQFGSLIFFFPRVAELLLLFRSFVYQFHRTPP